MIDEIGDNMGSERLDGDGGARLDIRRELSPSAEVLM
jgi:hypothetical protein